MADTTQTNYPDILGYITGGARYNLNVAQVALAVRPRIVRAGRPFEAILLVQNASDVDVDVTVALHLPEQDARRQKGKFIAKSARLVVGLRPAEVGYVKLPVACLPDTAVSDQYKLAMSIEVKALDKKAKRIRLSEGGGEVKPEYLPEETVTRLSEMKKLTFSVTRRGLIGTIIEAPFNVLGAQAGQLPDFKPGWVSLWKMSDHRDDSLLFERYRDLLERKVLPKLKREFLYDPLRAATDYRFKAAGFDLHPAEAHYITKLLVSILELARADESTIDYLGGEQFDIRLLLAKGLKAGPAGLPGWCRALLKTIDSDPSAADEPAAALAASCYDDLLRDAIAHGFHMVGIMTGEELGSDDDMKDYAERLVSSIIKPQNPLTFTDVYLPLVMGGVIYYDRAITIDEQVGEALRGIHDQLIERRAEMTEDNALVFTMADQIVDRAMQKFGYRT